MIFNFFSGIIGGIGLIFQGEWGLFFYGLAWAFAGAFVLSFALLPGMIFAPIAAWAAERNKVGLIVAAGIPAMAWTYIVVAVSCVAVFSAVVEGSDAGLFHILWGYSAATGPWSYMAQQEAKTGNDNAATVSFFAQLGVISMILATFLEPAHTEFGRLIYWFTPLLLLGLVFQLAILWYDTRNARHGYL